MQPLNHRQVVCGILLSLALTGLLNAPARAEERLRIGMVDYDEEQVVMLSEFVAHAYQALGYRAEFVPMAALQSVRAADAGKLDGELVRIAGIEAEFPNLVPVPVALYTMRLLAYSLQQRPESIRSCSDLRDYRVGIRLGVIVAQRCARLASRHAVPSYEDMLGLLLAGKVDLLLVEDVFGEWLQQSHGQMLVHEAGGPLLSIPLLHYLHRRHAGLVAPLARALLEQGRNGLVQRLSEQHGLPGKLEIRDLRATAGQPD